MASCKIGHVYIVETTLTKPLPKKKFALCVCVSERFFVWINTKPRPDGRDQLSLSAGCHELVTHDSHLDLSHVVVHQEWELEDAREFPMISRDLRDAILAAIDAGLDLMPPRHSELIVAELRTLYR
jgi:hypothetical protein